MVYYNEIDAYAAQWLRNLIDAGHIAKGDVDTRSIVDVQPEDLKGYKQCHFFAGIGVWSYALRQAGWSDDREVWTGSCPCQPFSSAGKKGTFDDERHLWPEMFRLIAVCKPSVVFGEQVASKDGLSWLDSVQADLEEANYTSAAADLCAAGVGAPHIRQRLYWVAYTQRGASERYGHKMDAASGGSKEEIWTRTQRVWNDIGNGSNASGGVYTSSVRQCGRCEDETRQQSEVSRTGCESVFAGQPAARPTNGHWRDVDWLYCQDGKRRPVEPGTFPLAHGITAKVGRLRAYGNAIVPQVAQTFIEAYMDL